MKSDVIKVGVNAAPQRSLLNALGLTEEEMKKPIIGIVSSKNDIVPGHMNIDKVVEAVKMVTITPARLIGEDKTIGSIEVGKLADLVIFDENINVKSVYIDGNKIV